MKATHPNSLSDMDLNRLKTATCPPGQNHKGFKGSQDSPDFLNYFLTIPEALFLMPENPSTMKSVLDDIYEKHGPMDPIALRKILSKYDVPVSRMFTIDDGMIDILYNSRDATVQEWEITQANQFMIETLGSIMAGNHATDNWRPHISKSKSLEDVKVAEDVNKAYRANKKIFRAAFCSDVVITLPKAGRKLWKNTDEYKKMRQKIDLDPSANWGCSDIFELQSVSKLDQS